MVVIGERGGLKDTDELLCEKKSKILNWSELGEPIVRYKSYSCHEYICGHRKIKIRLGERQLMKLLCNGMKVTNAKNDSE